MPHVGGSSNPGGFVADPLGVFTPGTNNPGTDTSGSGLTSQAPASDSEDTSGKSNKFLDWFNTWIDSLWGRNGSMTPIGSQAAQEIHEFYNGSNNSGDSTNNEVNNVQSSNSQIDVDAWIKQIEDLLDKQYQFNQASADKSMAFEAEQAQINRDWQKMMSDTSYQRAMQDLAKAGINPLLAISNLTGASTPSGSMASGSSASGSYGSPNSLLTALVSAMNGNKQMISALLGSLVKILGVVAGSL